MAVPVAQIRALYFAELHFREAKLVAELLIERSKEPASHELIWGLYTGIVVSYCRSFGQNDGVPAISSSFRKFLDPKQQALHDRLLETRDTTYAHRDLTRDDQGLAPGLSAEESKNLRLEIHSDGRVTFLIARPGLHPAYASDIVKLCDFQIDRARTAVAAMVEHFAKGKSYAPGWYVLGETFP